MIIENRNYVTAVSVLNAEYPKLVEYEGVAWEVALAEKPYRDFLKYCKSSDNHQPELFTDEIQTTLETKCEIAGNQAGLTAVGEERLRFNQLKKEWRPRYRNQNVLDGVFDEGAAPAETDIDAWGLIYAMQDAAQVYMDAKRTLEATGDLEPSVEVLVAAALTAATQSTQYYLAERGNRLVQLKTMFSTSSKPQSGPVVEGTPESVAGEPALEDPRTGMSPIKSAMLGETITYLWGN